MPNLKVGNMVSMMDISDEDDDLEGDGSQFEIIINNNFSIAYLNRSNA